jgi:hypothetical protein
MGKSGNRRASADNSHTPRSVIKKRAHRKSSRRYKTRKGTWEVSRGKIDHLNYDNDEQASAFKSDHKLLDQLLPSKSAIYRPAAACDGKTGSVDLRNFSFLDNPEATMEMLSKICEMNISTRSHKINFEDAMPLDVAPYMVLGLVGHQFDQTRLSGGRITPFANKVLEEIGFVEHFKMTSNAPKLDAVDVFPIKLITCRQSGATSYKDLEAPHARVADEFTKGMEVWLSKAGFEFTEEGLASILAMISEILNNAILHGADEIGGEAWVSGFMVPYEWPNGQRVFACHISVINLGKSIFSSMQTCPERIRDRIERLIRRHRNGFRVRSSYWNEEALWTLYALQDGVTRIDDVRGGKGLMDMINLFSELSFDSSKLAIISGNVILNLKRQKPVFDENGMRRLALNDENDLEYPPKKEYLKLLRKPFPGTILTWRFFLDPRNLQKMAEAQT